MKRTILSLMVALILFACNTEKKKTNRYFYGSYFATKTDTKGIHLRKGNFTFIKDLMITELELKKQFICSNSEENDSSFIFDLDEITITGVCEFKDSNEFKIFTGHKTLEGFKDYCTEIK
jgi:hypothetical protein